MTDSGGFTRRFDAVAATIGGYELSQLLFVFAELGIPDRLADGPMTSDELAQQVGADASTLRRFLRALTSVRVVSVQDDGRLALTERGARFRRDAPGSLRALAIGPGQPWWWAAWGGLLESVRTGQPAFEKVHGQRLYDYLAADPDAAQIYGDYLEAFGQEEANAVADSVDFASASVVVDVGGGHGRLLEAVLERNPGLRGILFDQPATVAGAAGRRSASNVVERMELVGGDFLEAVPSGGDVYLLRQVLHDWDDDGAVRVLASIRRSIPDTGVLLVIQDMIPDDAGPARAKLIDIALLVLTGGRERTLGEYRDLLEAAAFSLVQVVETESGASVLHARPR